MIGIEIREVVTWGEWVRLCRAILRMMAFALSEMGTLSYSSSSGKPSLILSGTSSVLSQPPELPPWLHLLPSIIIVSLSVCVTHLIVN